MAFRNDPAPGAWITPTLLNSWETYPGFTDPAYRRDGNRVTLKGLIRLGVVGSPCFTLPPGYRPAEITHHAGITSLVTEATGAASTGTAHTHPVPIERVAIPINVKPDGTVTPASPAGNGYVSLDGISFIAEA